MQTRFFTFPDEATAFNLAKLHNMTTIDENGDDILVRFNNTYAIDVIGVLYKESGKMLTSSEGFEYPEFTPLDGWHVNVRIIDETKSIPDDFLPFEVFPVTPSRDFA